MFSVLEREPIPLGLLHWPLCVEMGFARRAEEGGEGMMVVDPTLVEEQVCMGGMVVGANREGEVVLVEKGGGVEVEGVRLLGAIGVGVGKVRELCGRVGQALERDREVRDKGGMSRELRAENER